MLNNLAVAALAFTLLSGAASFTGSAGSLCTSGGLWGENCNVSNNGSSIDVGGTIDGSDGGSGGSRGADGDSDDGDSDDRGGRSPGTGPAVPCDPTVQLCRGNYAVAIIETPTPTLTDLASFTPASPSVTGEPAGVGIVGIPTNFVATASEHVVTGQLFSRPVTVRFTPVAFTFSPGDGTTRTTTTGGSTWAELGLAPFTPTATSHVYTARGTYTANVAVQYAAAVDFGGGWIEVPDVLRLSSGDYPIQVYEARTALVAHTCLENPGGPGC